MGAEFQVETLEDMCSLMCDNTIPRRQGKMKYEAVIIWVTGEKEIHTFATQAEAEKACKNMVKTFGDQVEWTGTREVR